MVIQIIVCSSFKYLDFSFMEMLILPLNNRRQVVFNGSWSQLTIGKYSIVNDFGGSRNPFDFDKIHGTSKSTEIINSVALEENGTQHYMRDRINSHCSTGYTRGGAGTQTLGRPER